VFLALLSLVAGLPGALLPERTIRVGARLALGPAYENADDLDPRAWYVRAVRLQSIGAVVAGVLGLLLAAREPDDEPAAAEPAE
jgi:hypothetical protein